MKKITYIILIVLFSVSCNINPTLKYDDEYCDYSDCNPYEPFYADIKIKFTRNQENPNPTIYLMSGYYEDGIIIDTIFTNTENDNFVYKKVSINAYYTVFTKYKKGVNTIIAIDGKYVSKYSYFECDSLCWSIKNQKFNIKLK